MAYTTADHEPVMKVQYRGKGPIAAKLAAYRPMKTRKKGKGY
jgi:hypothetical protein